MNLKSKTTISLFFALVIIVIIVMASVPPVSRDAQTHHLALPKIWLDKGILAEVSDMEFSYYPQLIDLLYLVPVAIDMDITAKYIHFIFALGIVLLIVLYIRRYLHIFWGLLGGLMFLTLPIIVKLSVTVYVDLGLLFFFTGSLLSALVWLEDTRNIRWLVISGICGGLSMSVKYNAILSVVILVLLLAYFYLKTRQNKQSEQLNVIKYAALYSFIALFVFSPWLIRNYTLTNNPVYPLYQSFFAKLNPQTSDDLLSEKPIKMKSLVYRKLVYHESLVYTLSIPLRVFYEGQDDNTQFFDGRLNPLLLLFALILFFSKEKRWQNKFFMVFVILTLFYTLFAIDMRIRYIITIVPPMIILSIFGIYQLKIWLLRKFSKSITSFILAIFISIYFLYNISYMVDLFKKIDPLPYISGKISREEYIESKLSYYSLNQLANKVVPHDGKLLGIFTGNRRYYIDVPLTLDSKLLFRLSNQVDSVSDLAVKLSNKNITHMLVRMDLLNDELSRTEDKSKKIITDFFTNHAKPLAFNDRFVLYAIDSEIVGKVN